MSGEVSMKNVWKGLLCLGLLICVLLSSCVRKDADTGFEDLEAEAVERDIDTLRKSVSQYFDLSAFKGLEIYVWSMAEGDYRCGMLEGTNRNKTQNEIWELAANSVSIEEMKAILETYDVPDEEVFLLACSQPISSYQYSLDEDYCNHVSAQFDGRFACFPIMEFMEEGS